VALTFDEALSRVRELESRDGPKVRPDCGTFYLGHGGPTPKAIVFFHGMTNCPRQFRLLAEQFHARSCNVIAPRFPYHGLTDRMTEDQAKLTAKEMISIADETVDLAQGLGDEVLVVGLSIGATVAAWCAQKRSDVAEAVLISPLFGVRVVPRWATEAVAQTAMNLPNFHMWWDPIRRENMEGPDHVYPRFSTRALAELLLLAGKVKDEAAKSPPAARRVIVVTVATDLSVNNGATEELIRLWNSSGATRIETFEFDAKHGLDHDLIDPEQPGANPELVYPKIIELVLGLPENPDGG
jgi:pimeloyl-ACP methyl ester carboxylesterase